MAAESSSRLLAVTAVGKSVSDRRQCETRVEELWVEDLKLSFGSQVGKVLRLVEPRPERLCIWFKVGSVPRRGDQLIAMHCGNIIGSNQVVDRISHNIDGVIHVESELLRG